MTPPDTQDIHLWCIAHTPPAEEQLALLSPDEREHFEGIGAATVKQQYWQTRLGIRRILSFYAPTVPLTRWRFVRNAHGRPELHTPVLPFDLRFNISHTAGLIVIAVTNGGEVGVDVEHTSRQPRVLDLAHRYFSTRELANLRALDAGQQLARFLHLWTLKEAYIKACGMGLAIPLDSFSFQLKHGGIDVEFASSREDKPARWRFWQIQLMNDYLAAIALARESHPDRYRLQVMQLQDWERVERVPVSLLARTVEASP